MRKVLILLSVVLAVALCQNTKRRTTIYRPPYRPLDCIFGYKYLNGTLPRKVCKTKEEFFLHPRNETKCSILKKLKCYTFKNVTACLCVRKFNRPPNPDFPHNRCKPGFVWRCQRENGIRNRICECKKIGPVKVNITSRITEKCEKGTYLYCPRKGKCYCQDDHIPELDMNGDDLDDEIALPDLEP